MAANFNNQVLIRNTSALSGDLDYTMLRAGVVYDAFAVANGGTAGTVTIKKAADAITNALNINGGDKTLARTGEIDATYNSLASGDTLRITKTAAVSADVFVNIASTGYSA